MFRVFSISTLSIFGGLFVVCGEGACVASEMGFGAGSGSGSLRTGCDFKTVGDVVLVR